MNIRSFLIGGVCGALAATALDRLWFEDGDNPTTVDLEQPAPAPEVGVEDGSASVVSQVRMKRPPRLSPSNRLSRRLR